MVTERGEECPDCDGNNGFAERGLIFHEHDFLHIYPIRIRYTRGISDVIPLSSTSTFKKIKKIYPIDEQDVAVHLDAERILRTDHDLTTTHTYLALYYRITALPATGTAADEGR